MMERSKGRDDRLPARRRGVRHVHANAKQGVGKIQNVEILGAGKMKFTQNETALTVQLPGKQPSEHAIAFKIIGA